jgi:hypothetical protein
MLHAFLQKFTRCSSPLMLGGCALLLLVSAAHAFTPSAIALWLVLAVPLCFLGAIAIVGVLRLLTTIANALQ